MMPKSEIELMPLDEEEIRLLRALEIRVREANGVYTKQIDTVLLALDSVRKEKMELAEAVLKLKGLRELLSQYLKEVVDDPEEIECELACNADTFVAALSKVIESVDIGVK